MLKDSPSRLSRSSRTRFAGNGGGPRIAGQTWARLGVMFRLRRVSAIKGSGCPDAQVEHELCSEYSHAAPRLSKQQLARTRRWPGLGPE